MCSFAMLLLCCYCVVTVLLCCCWNHTPRLYPLLTPFFSAHGVQGNLTEEAFALKQATQRELARIVVPQLLTRCRAVLLSFVTDDRHSGNCPLPRYVLVPLKAGPDRTGISWTKSVGPRSSLVRLLGGTQTDGPGPR